MKDLCSSLEHSIWFVAILNSLKTNIFVGFEYFFAIKQFQTMQSLDLWKKLLKNKFILIFLKKRFPLYIEWPSYI